VTSALLDGDETPLPSSVFHKAPIVQLLFFLDNRKQKYWVLSTRGDVAARCDLRVNEATRVTRPSKNYGLSKIKFVMAVTSSEAGSVAPYAHDSYRNTPSPLGFL
jgi:hypothetical protein